MEEEEQQQHVLFEGNYVIAPGEPQQQRQFSVLQSSCSSTHGCRWLLAPPNTQASSDSEIGDSFIHDSTNLSLPESWPSGLSSVFGATFSPFQQFYTGDLKIHESHMSTASSDDLVNGYFGCFCVEAPSVTLAFSHEIVANSSPITWSQKVGNLSLKKKVLHGKENRDQINQMVEKQNSRNISAQSRSKRNNGQLQNADLPNKLQKAVPQECCGSRIKELNDDSRVIERRVGDKGWRCPKEGKKYFKSKPRQILLDRWLTQQR